MTNVETLRYMLAEYPENGWTLEKAALQAAIAALESPTPAMRAVKELVEADKEYDAAREEYASKAPDGLGELDERTDADYARLANAKYRRNAALAEVAKMLGDGK